MSHSRPPILDDLSAAIRTRHYSRRTEKAYAHWVIRFLRYHGFGPIEGLGAPEVNAFLSHLAVKEQVAASTQSQARAALLFLYRYVLRRPLGSLLAAMRPSARTVETSIVGVFFSTLPAPEEFGRSLIEALPKLIRHAAA